MLTTLADPVLTGAALAQQATTTIAPGTAVRVVTSSSEGGGDVLPGINQPSRGHFASRVTDSLRLGFWAGGVSIGAIGAFLWDINPSPSISPIAYDGMELTNVDLTAANAGYKAGQMWFTYPLPPRSHFGLSDPPTASPFTSQGHFAFAGAFWVPMTAANGFRYSDVYDGIFCFSGAGFKLRVMRYARTRYPENGNEKPVEKGELFQTYSADEFMAVELNDKDQLALVLGYFFTFPRAVLIESAPGAFTPLNLTLPRGVPRSLKLNNNGNLALTWDALNPDGTSYTGMPNIFFNGLELQIVGQDVAGFGTVIGTAGPAALNDNNAIATAARVQDAAGDVQDVVLAISGTVANPSGPSSLIPESMVGIRVDGFPSLGGPHTLNNGDNVLVTVASPTTNLQIHHMDFFLGTASLTHQSFNADLFPNEGNIPPGNTSLNNSNIVACTFFVTDLTTYLAALQAVEVQILPKVLLTAPGGIDPEKAKSVPTKERQVTHLVSVKSTTGELVPVPVIELPKMAIIGYPDATTNAAAATNLQKLIDDGRIKFDNSANPLKLVLDRITPAVLPEGAQLEQEIRVNRAKVGTVKVIIPPQVLIQLMLGEAHGPMILELRGGDGRNTITNNAGQVLSPTATALAWSVRHRTDGLVARDYLPGFFGATARSYTGVIVKAQYNAFGGDVFKVSASRSSIVNFGGPRIGGELKQDILDAYDLAVETVATVFGRDLMASPLEAARGGLAVGKRDRCYWFISPIAAQAAAIDTARTNNTTGDARNIPGLGGLRRIMSIPVQIFYFDQLRRSRRTDGFVFMREMVVVQTEGSVETRPAVTGN